MRHVYLTLSFLVGIWILCGCSSSSNEFSGAVSKFKDGFNNTTSFYFYKSTLSMLNFVHDTSFNKLIRDVKKLRVLTFKNDKGNFDRKLMSGLANDIRKESFVDMMQVSKDGYTILVFMQKHNGKPRKFVGLGYDLQGFFIVDLVGSIPLSVLPSIINGKFNKSGLESVLNFTGTDNFNKGPKHKKDNGDNPGNQ